MEKRGEEKRRAYSERRGWDLVKLFLRLQNMRERNTRASLLYRACECECRFLGWVVVRYGLGSP